MACSKFQVDINTVKTKISRVHGPPLNTQLSKDEMDVMCCVVKKRAVSIELINHMMGGPNMDYHCIENDESFEAFDYLQTKLLDELKEDKLQILFFEDRIGVSSNIIIVVVLKNAKHGVREHIVLKALIWMSINLHPQVGYCRFFDITGNVKF